GIDEIEKRRAPADSGLELCVFLHIGRREGWSADAREVLGELLVIHELWTGHAHQFDPDAQNANVVDVGRTRWTGPRTAYPRGESSSFAAHTRPPLGGQARLDSELAPDLALTFGCACAPALA